MRRILVTAIVLALAGAAPAFAADTVGLERASASPTTQLPLNIRPRAYDIAITPHAEAMAFDGRVKIELQVLQPSGTITLNAIDMQFSRVALVPLAGGAALKPASVKVDAEHQVVVLDFARRIGRGQYRLELDYTGKIGTQANGLFAIDYDTPKGRKRALYTQFENSDARRFIPSWDEPGFRTPFSLQVTVPAKQMAVSNMPAAERQDLGNGLARVRFQTTPAMSTYLLFFALGDFERATDHAGKTEVGVVAQSGLLPQAAWSLSASKEILPEYNDYFGVPFPLPKLDNVASPGSSQFFGAMENWGSIFTFESVMLVDPSISTAQDKQRIWQIAAHEIAHQWFGNLVTMAWWDDLWLNEGFASWMESRTTAKLHPEWNTALARVASREEAMALDSIESTHPIVQHVETVEQAAQAFDDITYDKGQAVIGMIENYVGAEAWRDGVRRYMKQHAYGNTVSDDLWHSIEQGGGAKISDIAHDFTLQPGIPLIEVGAASCSQGQTRVTLTQGEFTVDRPDKQALRWRVPVVARTLGQAPARTVVTGGKGDIVLAGCGPVLVNAGQAGYYRSLYAPQAFRALATNFRQLAPIDQLGLMGDSWALGQIGRQPASDVFDLIQATPVDADTQVWGKIAAVLGEIDGFYPSDSPARRQLRRFASVKLSPVLARVGWEAKAGEPATVAILRNQLIAALGGLGDPAVLAEARRRFDASAADASALPGDIRKTVLGVIARHADSAGWERLQAMARAETTPQIKDNLYALLASSEDAGLAQRALDLAMTEEPGATNTAEMVTTVAHLHPELAFDFAMAHREPLEQRIDFTSRSRYFPALANTSLQASIVPRVRSYAQTYLAEGSRRSAEQAIARVENRIRIREQRLPQIEAWLAKQAAP